MKVVSILLVSAYLIQRSPLCQEKSPKGGKGVEMGDFP